jgi:hypothetical protein
MTTSFIIHDLSWQAARGVGAIVRVADHSPEARESYFRRYTTVVSVSAGSGVGSPYISHECPADSLRFAAIHFLIAPCASFMRL